MTSLTVDSRVFLFSDGWLAMKYDDTPYYTNKFKGRTGCSEGLKKEMKAVDVIATDCSEQPPTMYFIESKDYRHNRRTKEQPPAEEFIQKVLDTLTGMLPTVLCSDSWEHGERNLHQQLQITRKLRLVYQFEQPRKHSKLFPRDFDTKDIQQKIRLELKAIDPHALVIEAATQSKVKWKLTDT